MAAEMVTRKVMSVTSKIRPGRKGKFKAFTVEDSEGDYYGWTEYADDFDAEAMFDKALELEGRVADIKFVRNEKGYRDLVNIREASDQDAAQTPSQAPGGQSRGSGRSDEARESIERQVALKEARPFVQFLIEAGAVDAAVGPATVANVTEQFARALRGDSPTEVSPGEAPPPHGDEDIPFGDDPEGPTTEDDWG